jgi:hypothetical protein
VSVSEKPNQLTIKLCLRAVDDNRPKRDNGISCKLTASQTA